MKTITKENRRPIGGLSKVLEELGLSQHAEAARRAMVKWCRENPGETGSLTTPGTRPGHPVAFVFREFDGDIRFQTEAA